MLKYVNLESVLCNGKEYVAKLSKELGLDVFAVKHNIATDTCFEKAELLNWSAKRIVKAIYLSNRDHIYGFVFPELGIKDYVQKIKTKDISRVLGISGKKAKKYSNSYCPESMEKGTCTPFVTSTNFNCSQEKPLRKIFIHDIPSLNKEFVDISIGGYGEEAHKISLHLSYGSIYEILNYKFEGRIEKVDLFNKI